MLLQSAPRVQLEAHRDRLLQRAQIGYGHVCVCVRVRLSVGRLVFECRRRLAAGPTMEETKAREGKLDGDFGEASMWSNRKSKPHEAHSAERVFRFEHGRPRKGSRAHARRQLVLDQVYHHHPTNARAPAATVHDGLPLRVRLLGGRIPVWYVSSYLLGLRKMRVGGQTRLTRLGTDSSRCAVHRFDLRLPATVWKRGCYGQD